MLPHSCDTYEWKALSSTSRGRDSMHCTIGASIRGTCVYLSMNTSAAMAETRKKNGDDVSTTIVQIVLYKLSATAQATTNSTKTFRDSTTHRWARLGRPDARR